MKILIEVMDQNFATKADLETGLRDMRTEMNNRFQEMRVWTETGFREVRTEMQTGFRELEYKLTIKLGAMLTVAVAVTATLTKIL